MLSPSLRLNAETPKRFKKYFRKHRNTEARDFGITPVVTTGAIHVDSLAHPGSGVLICLGNHAIPNQDNLGVA
jgi:hypothetical protein